MSGEFQMTINDRKIGKKYLSNIPSDYLLQYGGRKKRDNHPEYYSHYEEDYYHNPHERDYQFYEDFSVDTIEDCFADIPAPRYGYVVRITYTRTGKLTSHFLIIYILEN